MFVLGDFVFAKMEGKRPWPARILGRYGTVSEIEYSVFLYGNCNTVKLSSSHILNFEKNKRNLGARRLKKTPQNADFRRAMRLIWKAFSKPKTDTKYYKVLAAMKDESNICLPYEMLPPTVSKEDDSEDSEQGDNTTDTESSSEEDTTETESSSATTESDTDSGEEDSEDSQTSTETPMKCKSEGKEQTDRTIRKKQI